ncbi:MAG: phosphate uptake regulator PhoU [Nanoarchaeota archaeon]|nr:phosphate uptake regulator PhoU [Nanoarchaeota archaeon]
MKRKIVKLGPSTLVVSLPAKWTQKFHLKPGNEIDLKEEPSRLVLTPSDAKPLQTKKEISLGKRPPRSVVKYIAGAYKKGYDELTIKFDHPEVMDIIEDYMPSLLGYEIVQQENNKCVIKNVAEALEFDQIMRRTFLVLMSIGEQIIENIQNKDYNKLKQIPRLDKNINKNTDFCKMQLVKKSYEGKKESFYLYTINSYLELIGNEYRDIAKQLAKTKTITQDELNHLKEIIHYLREFYEIFYKFDEKKEAAFVHQREHIIKKSYNLLKKQNTDKILVHHIFKAGLLTYQMIGSLFGLHL